MLGDELGGRCRRGSSARFLRSRNLALIVTRNVTRRADRQQPFNLRVAGGARRSSRRARRRSTSATSRSSRPTAPRLRGPTEGRRPLARSCTTGCFHRSAARRPARADRGGRRDRRAGAGAACALLAAHRPGGGGVVRERNWMTFARRDPRLRQLPRRGPAPMPCSASRADQTTAQALRELASWWQATHDVGAPTPTPRRAPRPRARPRRPPLAPATATAAQALVSGQVRYYREDRPVSDVLLPPAPRAIQAAPSRSAPVGANLVLTGRSGEINGAVSALDAAWALQFAAEGLRAFDADQRRLRRDRRRNGERARRHASSATGWSARRYRCRWRRHAAQDFAFVPGAVRRPSNQRLVMPVERDVVLYPRRRGADRCRRPAARTEFPRHRLRRLRPATGSRRRRPRWPSRARGRCEWFPCAAHDATSCASRSPRSGAGPGARARAALRPGAPALREGPDARCGPHSAWCAPPRSSPAWFRMAAAGVRRSRGIRLLASFRAARGRCVRQPSVTVGAANVDETMVRATVGRH